MPRFEDREKVYNGVLQTILKAPPEGPVGFPRVNLYQNRKQAGHSLEQVKKAVGAAKSNDDLIEYYDDKGKIRYVIPTESNLTKVIQHQIDRDGEPNRKLIGECNRLLTELRGE